MTKVDGLALGVVDLELLRSHWSRSRTSSCVVGPPFSGSSKHKHIVNSNQSSSLHGTQMDGWKVV